MKDYSQHGEQAHILKFFDGFKGRFLDIGAFDGITGSNTRALVELGWTGVCIEASPLVFRELVKNAKHTVSCCNAAVMDSAGLVKFYDNDGQCGTCLDNQDLERVVPTQRTYWVGAITPKMIADTFGGHFDFISLDIEGMDLNVLREFEPVAEHTRLLCFEDSIPCHKFDPKYYDQMIFKSAALDLTQIIFRSGDTIGGGNTLIARKNT